MHRNIASEARSAQRRQIQQDRKRNWRMQPRNMSDKIMLDHQDPRFISPQLFDTEDWFGNWRIDWAQYESKIKAEQAKYGPRRRKLSVHNNLRRLKTNSTEASIRMSDQLDFSPNGGVRRLPHTPQQIADPHFDRECAACGEFHPTEEHEVIYVDACFEEHASLGLGRWSCPQGCLTNDLFELDYAV